MATSFCGIEGHNEPVPGCKGCQKKVVYLARINAPGTAQDSEDFTPTMEQIEREKFFERFAGSLGICGSGGTKDDPSPAFENGVRQLEDGLNG